MSILEQRVLVHDSAVWRTADLERDREWVIAWSAAELAEMRAIAAAAGHNWHEANKFDVAAPALTQRLEALASTLETGKGLVLLRGAPVDAWTEAEAKAVTLWMGWRLGVPRGQNAEGALLSAVRDVGASYANDPEARGYMSSDELQPHTDGCDVTGLMCFKRSKQGGETRIASSLAIYNHICETEPELIEPLVHGFPFYIRDADGKGGRLLPAPLPVYFEQAGFVSACFNPKSVEVAAAKRGEPLSHLERRALERARELAGDPQFCAELLLEPGDMLLFSNWTTFHSRRSFVDHDDPAERRCLIRLWIHSRVERPLPMWMAAAARGGLGQQST